MAASVIDPIQMSQPPAGVVLPPKDIRAIVETTAGYVVRNGIQFEQRIREKERANMKFSFLDPKDAYNPYYEWRMDEIKGGRGGLPGAKPGAVAAQPAKPTGPQQPPDFRFSARMPAISAQDLDIVRLTALYTAKFGRNFVHTLAQREHRNFQFDFLRPNHSFNSYFMRLVDQYTELLEPLKVPQQVRELQAALDNKYDVLEQAGKRAEWIKFQEGEKAKKEAEEDKEQLAYAQVDWHDFVVVETVIFTEADELAELALPKSLNELLYASLEDKNQNSLNPGQLRIEEAMPTSDNYPEFASTQSYPSYPSYPTSYAPPPIQSQQSARPDPDDVDMAVSEDEDDSVSTTAAALVQQQAKAQALAASATQIPSAASVVPRANVRAAPLPRAVVAAQNKRAAATMAKCPQCNQLIPAAELQEHMRIELLDPRWKEQKARAEAKTAVSNLTHNDVAENIKRLASNRDDIFDSDTGRSMGLSEEELARRKRQAMMSWDGTETGKEQSRIQRVQGVGVVPQGQAVVQPGAAPGQQKKYDINEQLQEIRRKAELAKQQEHQGHGR